MTMSTASATTDGPVANGTGGGPPLSKSQKKRMKQKASKAKKAEAEAARAAGGGGSAGGGGGAAAGGSGGGAAGVLRPNAATLNPHDKLRADVASRGFTLEEVDVAMEEMWEKQMKYDVLDDVVLYLESKAESRRNGGHFEEEVKAAASRDQSVRTTATSESTRIESPVGSSGQLQQQQQQDERQQVEEAAEETKSDAGDDDGGRQPQQAPVQAQAQAGPAPASSASSGRRRRKKKAAAQAPMDLMAKLDVVANSENLSDAIFALTEWATKAAKQSEISDLCNLQKSRALSTILRRSISSEDDDDTDSVLVMIESILVAAGSDASSASAVSSALGSAIGKARSVASTASTAADPDAIKSNAAAVLSDQAVSGLSRTVERMRYSTVDDGDRAIRSIEEEIDSLASSLTANNGGAGGGILGLMTKRDCHKVAADKSSTVVGIAIAAAARASAAESGAKAAEAAAIAAKVDKGKVVSSVLGDEHDAVETSRAEYEALRTELDEARSSSSTERAALASERDGYQAEREAMSGRMDALRKELEGLEREHAALGAKVDDAESRLDELDAELDEGVRDIKAKLSERSGAVKLGDAVGAVADGIEELEGTLARSSAAAKRKSADGGVVGGEGGSRMTPERVSNKMGIYFVRMRNYFKAEADCVEFMLNRADSLESGLGDLEREIEECKALGMTTNVAQMNQSLKETKRNVAEDRGVVTALRGEAEKMRDNFMVRLEEYQSTRGDGAETNSALTSLQLSVLSGIRDAMSRIGLDNAGLSEYIDSVAADASVPLQDTSLSESQIIKHFGDGDDGAEGSKDGAEEGSDFGGGSATAVSGAVLPLQNSTAADSAAADVPPEPSKAVAPPSTSPAKAMPKLSWAASAAPKKAAGKSLLEIQQEELSAKESGSS